MEMLITYPTIMRAIKTPTPRRPSPPPLALPLINYEQLVSRRRDVESVKNARRQVSLDEDSLRKPALPNDMSTTATPQETSDPYPPPKPVNGESWSFMDLPGKL